jgi:outer membrane murein-binding lipoprotein Lpp
MQRTTCTFWCIALCLLAGASRAESPSAATMARQIEAVLEENAQLRSRLEALEAEVRSARDEAATARDEAAAARALAESPTQASAPASVGTGPIGQVPVGGGAQLQLLDLSVDVLTSVGTSSVDDETLESLQGGGHDPRQRGFNLQNLELSMLGAVDPYVDGEVHLIYFLDAEGESQFELEEAFATTRMLPFGLEERGFQLEFGQMFTEFGRINPQHPHTWDWQDQPVVLSRFFGEDGMRGLGTRLGWLLPVPWFSELHAGIQNSDGETMYSFNSSDEAFEERAIGGRPFESAGTRSFDDMVYLLRWVNGVDLSDTWTGQLGLSGLYGPNATGSDGETWIYGADFVLKWIPLTSNRGWPFVKLEGEIMQRRYEADSFFGCLDPDEDPCTPVALPTETLDDWGGFLQALWGFRRGWSIGLRGEYATGSGGSNAALEYARSEDPFRDDRLRISPLLVFQPSEFSRIRLQYNWDKADFLDGSDDPAHSVWLGFEWLFGSHPAHAF